MYISRVSATLLLWTQAQDPGTGQTGSGHWPGWQWPDWQAILSSCPLVSPRVRSFVCYQSCQHDLLRTTNESILMQIDISDRRVKDVEWATLTFRRSKVNVSRGRRQIGSPGGGIIVDSFRSSGCSSSMFSLPSSIASHGKN